MHIDIPHQFKNKEEAIARVKHALAEAGPQLGDKATIKQEEWQGDTLIFAADIQGQNISGTLVVREKVFDINAKLPLMMRMFEGRIEKAIKAQTGMTVLEAAKTAGIYIPTLCYHPDLKPYGGCRLCVVEIEGVRGLPTSCTIPVTDGMIVKTETEAVTKVRKTVVELLIADHASPYDSRREFYLALAYEKTGRPDSAAFWLNRGYKLKPLYKKGEE